MADEEKVIPIVEMEEKPSMPYHFHSGQTGGELAFNDLQLVGYLNGVIAALNKKVNPAIKQPLNDIVGPDGQTINARSHIPFIVSDPYPKRAYNTHHHSSEYDGGFIFGDGLHDHRSNGAGGFAYAVYHPGSSLPKLAYEREEVLEP